MSVKLVRKTFSDEIYHSQMRMGLTQQQVAEAVSVSVRWYQHLEKGTYLPGAVVMLRLILFLGIDVEVFRESLDLCVPVYTK